MNEKELCISYLLGPRFPLYVKQYVDWLYILNLLYGSEHFFPGVQRLWCFFVFLPETGAIEKLWSDMGTKT